MTSANTTSVYSAYIPSYSPFQRTYTPDPLPTDYQQGMNLDNGSLMVDSTYLQAQQSLEDVLALGLTYDDLIAEGMHPVFLDQLFARIKSQSSPNSSRENSVPKPTATPDPFLAPKQPIPVKPIPQQRLISDVDNFLDNLEPSISSPNRNDDSKKRGPPSNTPHHPPKRRAFGLAPPKKLIIDISDDEDDDDDDDNDDNDTDKPSPVLNPRRGIVKIPERPTLTQYVITRRNIADL